MRIQRLAKPATSAAIVLLSVCGGNAITITTAPKVTSTGTVSVDTTCEFRTINYITDSLPRKCLKSAWSHLNGAASVKIGEATVSREGSPVANSSVVGQDAVENNTGSEAVAAEPVLVTSSATPTALEEAAATDLESGELNDASFLSFEEWKKQTLEKAGQVNTNFGGRKSENKKKDIESFQNNLESLDEGEINIDFDAFRSGKKGEEVSQTREPEVIQATHGKEPKQKDQYRSKDAGKTCKERFSYASFDAGATILKTHAGAKNSKAVLIENKDSYMLSECSAENKFLIIELSEDIWIDTLVLANYEFFSSMVRNFRVSASDRYPVKMEKWKDLGTYEARNSREIQAFLIENPQIWARYIRIEFLSHYGNEYYCPLSLVRVHGTRMLESWKETEANGDDEEESDENEAAAGDQFVPDAVAEVVQEEIRINAQLKEAQAAIDELVKIAQNITANQTEPTLNLSNLGDVDEPLQATLTKQMTTPWFPDFDFGYWMNVTQGLDMCLPCEAPSPPQPVSAETASVHTVTSFTGPCEDPTPISLSVAADIKPGPVTSVVSQSEAPSSTENSSVQEASAITSSASNSTASASISNSNTHVSSTAPAASVTIKPQNITSTVKNKTSTASSVSPALPTQQESFFKAVSRRLQLLETNSTLSLKYIEEQSKILREAFTKVEKKQLSKTTNFLDTLNNTVLTELREVRQQYDEIWQSTVISLEIQREESRREILAISSRLNILADEVVFQKRMSIIQSVLLLLCLGLVIFSRVTSAGHLDFYNRSRILSGFVVESPVDHSSPESQESRRTNSLPEGRRWEAGHQRQRSDDSAISGEVSRDESPPTPISSYSHSENDNDFTPPLGSGADDVTPQPNTPSMLLETPLKHPSSPRIPSRSSSSAWNDLNAKAQVPQSLSQSIRTPKKRKAFIRPQQESPSPSPFPEPSTRIPIISTTSPTQQSPASPHHESSQPYSTPQKSPKGRDRDTSPRNRRQSFSIARKPLPALPGEE